MNIAFPKLKVPLERVNTKEQSMVTEIPASNRAMSEVEAGAKIGYLQPRPNGSM